MLVLPPEMIASCQKRDANALQAMNCERRSTDIITSDGSSLNGFLLFVKKHVTIIDWLIDPLID